MKLHEQTQRFILLLIFYLFGPILTLGVIGGIVLRNLPANARHWERTLTQQTGLHWKIKSIEYRSPGFIRLHEVEIQDDTAQNPDTVFYTKQIDVRRITNTSRDKIFPGIGATFDGEPPTWSGLTAVLTNLLAFLRSDDHFWQITAPLSFLNFRDYPGENSALLVQNLLRKVFARFETLADESVQFIFEEIYVISEYSLKKGGTKAEDKTDLFRLVQGNIYRTPAEIRSDWSFEIKDFSDIDRLHLSFALSLNDTLEVTFRTGKQPIPCDLAAVFYSPFKHFSGGSLLGEYALSTRSGHNSQTTRMNNAIFKNVPLAPLIGSYTDFAVAGTIADLQFDRAVFGAEGISVDGCLKVQNGIVEKALFHRCVDNFALTVQPENILDSPMRMIPFTACVVHFRLQREGINFWADQLWSNDAFMYQRADANGPLDWVVRFPSHRRTVTYHELMSIFVADNTPTVPLIPGYQSLLQHMPMQ